MSQYRPVAAPIGHRTAGLHHERHLIERVGWLRAAVLGANDGIVSTASLILGVAAAAGTRHGILTAGVAGLVAGAMAMAAGEFVSVSSQSDTERADWARERGELASNPEFEREELAHIYAARGVDPELAQKVAVQLMAKDSLAAHGRDELGISENTPARPVQAAVTSALTFATGAALPLITATIAPSVTLIPIVAAASLCFLAILGAIGAIAGGASVLTASVRVSIWGAIAMAATAGVGMLFGTVAV
jgi:vacuolar iron transporter family protein